FRKIRDAKPIIEERITIYIDANFEIVLKGITNLHKPVRKPIPEAIAIENRHGDIDIGLELNQPLARIGDSSITNPAEFHAIPVLKSLRKRNEIIRIHLECIRMARITDYLILTGKLSLSSARPVAFDGFAEHDHGPSIFGIPFLHFL